MAYREEQVIEEVQQSLLPVVGDDGCRTREGGQLTALGVKMVEEVGPQPGQFTMNPGGILGHDGAPQRGRDGQ